MLLQQKKILFKLKKEGGNKMFGLGKKHYVREVERTCKKYELSLPIKHYFESFSSPRSEQDKRIILNVLKITCSGEQLTEATKCLEEIMKIK